MNRDKRKRQQVKTFKIRGTTVRIQAPPLNLTKKEVELFCKVLRSEFNNAMARRDGRTSKDVLNLVEKLALPDDFILEITNKYYAEFEK